MFNQLGGYVLYIFSLISKKKADFRIRNDNGLVTFKIAEKFTGLVEKKVGPDQFGLFLSTPQTFRRLVGQDKVFGEAVQVIEAFPRWRACSYLNPGKIWVSSEDGAVLKIERSYQLEKNCDKVRLRGLIMNLDPRLTFISEFAFEKNGIRYPSRIVIRESYFSGEEEKLVRAVIESTYSDYRFFGVSSEVKTEKEG